MKILIVSDTHRHNENLVTVLEKVGHIDLLIHLGDSEGAENYIRQIASCPVEIVAGNNDFFSKLDKEKELMLEKYKVMLTHGHYYNVSVGLDLLRNEAISRNVDIVMFGHTHRPLISIEDKVTIINPGSLSYPRQEGRRPSYILMEIDDKDEAHYTINYL